MKIHPLAENVIQSDLPRNFRRIYHNPILLSMGFYSLSWTKFRQFSPRHSGLDIRIQKWTFLVVSFHQPTVL